MLGSWFASKPDDEKITDLSRRSAEALDGTNLFHSSTVDPAGPTREPLRRTITTALSTPHDAVLAELHGHHPDMDTSTRVDRDGVPGFPPHDMGDGNHHFNVNVNEFGGHGLPPGLAALTPSYSMHFAREEILHDPFDGKPLGSLVPLNPILHPEVQTKPSEAARKNEELWTHLSRVLELQSKVATMHVEMEGVRGKPGEGKGKGKSGGSRSWEEGKGVGVRSRATSVAGEDGEGEDEGVSVEGDEEAEKNKAREEEFAKLAEKFEGTKESINGIMSTLDDLSKALTNFHALQAPKIEFPNSRYTSLQVNSEVPPKTAPKKPAPFTSTLPSPDTSVIIPMSISHSEPPPTTTASLIASSPGSRTPTALVESPQSMMHNTLPAEE